MALVALVVVVRSLDRPWLKRRLRAMAHDKTGLDVDWTATHVALFSGLRVERLVVKTPPALARDVRRSWCASTGSRWRGRRARWWRARRASGRCASSRWR